MSQAKPRILFFNPVRHAVAEYESLKSVSTPEVVTSKTRAEFFSDLRSKYQDVHAIWRTSASGAVRHLMANDAQKRLGSPELTLSTDRGKV